MPRPVAAIAPLVAVALGVAAWLLLVDDERVRGELGPRDPQTANDVALTAAGPVDAAGGPARTSASPEAAEAIVDDHVARPAARFDVRGRVLDDAGDAVTLFQVELQPREGGASRRASSQHADGAFVFEDLEAGTWYARPSAEGYLPLGVVGVDVPSDRPLELRLQRCGTVSVEVVDPTGRPVAGARVEATSPAYHAPFDLFEVASTTTDALGCATLFPVRLSAFRVEATADGFADGASELLQLSALERHARARIALTRGGRVEGELRTVDGLPADGVRLTLWHRESWQTWSARAGPDGTFSFEQVPAGQLALSTEVQGAEREQVPYQSLELEVREGETTVARFRDLHGSRVEVVGRLLRDDEPVAGAELWFHGRGAGGGIGAQTTRTSADGGFALALPVSGPYRVEASRLGDPRAHASWLRFHVDVPTVATFDLVLAYRTGGVSGRVLDAAGDPAPGALVFLTGRDDAVFHEVKADGRGRYEAVHVPEGTYDVRAQPRSALLARQSPRAGDTLRAVTVVAGGAVRGLDLRLPTYVSIEGTVVGRDGSPAVSAEIELAGGSGAPALASSDVSGAFSVTEIEPGDYWLRATWGHDTSAWIRITAPTTDPPRLALGPGARVTVRLAADASPSERLRIDAVDALGRYGATALLAGRAVELGPLPPGTYRLVASRSSGAVLEEVEVPLTAGEEWTWILRGED